MKATFDHKLIQSLYLYLDNRICNDGQGYINTSSLLYKQNDEARPLTSYASPYKQWIYDSCVAGAQIPSGVWTSSGQFLTRSSGIFIDFNEGRILSSGNWGPSLSGDYARKEYNIYFSTDEQASFYLEQINNNKNVEYPATGGAPYKFAAPCVILTNSYGENQPFAMGGLQNTQRTAKLFTISNNNFNQESLTTLLVDSKEKYFSLVESEFMPLAFYGDLKTGYYCYGDIQSRFPCGSGVFIDGVYGYRVSDKQNKNNYFTISIFEFNMSKVRFRDT